MKYEEILEKQIINALINADSAEALQAVQKTYLDRKNEYGNGFSESYAQVLWEKAIYKSNYNELRDIDSFYKTVEKFCVNFEAVQYDIHQFLVYGLFPNIINSQGVKLKSLNAEFKAFMTGKDVLFMRIHEAIVAKLKAEIDILVIQLKPKLSSRQPQISDAKRQDITERLQKARQELAEENFVFQRRVAYYQQKVTLIKSREAQPPKKDSKSDGNAEREESITLRSEAKNAAFSAGLTRNWMQNELLNVDVNAQRRRMRAIKIVEEQTRVAQQNTIHTFMFNIFLMAQQRELLERTAHAARQEQHQLELQYHAMQRRNVPVGMPLSNSNYAMQGLINN